MTREEINQIKHIIHRTIYKFFDFNDNEETPMSEKDKLLLSVNKAICNNIEALEQEPKAEWISVKDELPKKNKKYLCTLNGCGHNFVETINFTDNLREVNKYDFPDCNRGGWYIYDSECGYCEVENVVAWMELPKPYKEESE